MSISVSSQVLGTLSVTIAETTGTLSVSVLSTAPAVLSMELGTPGPAASVTVGETTTLSPGSYATVSNSGTELAAVLNFGIPRGADGEDGAPGVGVPADGLEGYILAKASDTSYDTVWVQNYSDGVTASVRNETGATLSKGTVVYINGASGNKATVAKAQANSEATSSKTYAIIQTDLPNNQNGVAVVLGQIRGLDTSAFTEGANLWLSPTVAGAITQTQPSAPNHAVFLGNVSRVHANQGTIEVRIINGYEIQELHNVSITSVTNGDLLVYESATSLWKNKSISTLGLATQAWVDAQGYLQSGALTGYLLASTAAATYQPIGSYVTEAPSDGTPYVRKNGAWEQLIIS